MLANTILLIDVAVTANCSCLDILQPLVLSHIKLFQSSFVKILDKADVYLAIGGDREELQEGQVDCHSMFLTCTHCNYLHLDCIIKPCLCLRVGSEQFYLWESLSGQSTDILSEGIHMSFCRRLPEEEPHCLCRSGIKGVQTNLNLSLLDLFVQDVLPFHMTVLSVDMEHYHCSEFVLLVPCRNEVSVEAGRVRWDFLLNHEHWVLFLRCQVKNTYRES